MNPLFPELIDAVAQFDGGAARTLDRPASVRRRPRLDALAVHPLPVLWAAVVSSLVLVLFTAPRLQAWRDGLEASPLEGGGAAVALALGCLFTAVGFTAARLRRPRGAFRRRLLDALASGHDAPGAVLAACGLPGPALVDGAVAPQVARALRRGLGRTLGAAAGAVLERSQGRERGLTVLARGAHDDPPSPLATFEQLFAVAAAAASAAVTFFTYLKGLDV